MYGGPIQSVGKLCEALDSLIVGDQLLSVDYVRDDTGRFQHATDYKHSAPVMVPGSWEVEKSLQVAVFTTTANGKDELEVETGKAILVNHIPVTYFKRWTKDHSHFSPGLLINLRNEILRCAQDDKIVIHIHAWWNLVSVFSCLMARWYKVPVLLSPRGMLTPYSQNNRHSSAKNFIHQTIGKRLLKYCHIHATSAQEKREILAIVQPKSIRVIPNLVKFPSIVQHLSLDDQEEGNADLMIKDAIMVSGEQQITIKQKPKTPFKLLFLSRIEEKKGLDLLFDALETLPISWTLTIAGSGDKNYIESLKLKVESLKLSDRIQWIGHVDNEHKFELMADHNLLLLTSYNENFANVIIESLSVGTPVLVSEHVGLSEYVKEHQLGWITSLQTPHVAETILAAARSTDLLANIRKTAPDIIKRDFNDEVLAKQYLQLYQKIK